MTEDGDLGPCFTSGDSFRARAERRQREVRANTPGVGWSRYGHLLDPAAAGAGANFVTEVAFQAARNRQAAGKGVAPRTFNNMLSSQAMCFNLFAPLAAKPDLATEVLAPFIPGLATVRDVHTEHTPPSDVFGDQTGRGGVDCDVLVVGDWADGSTVVVVIETKLVEKEFSCCGFRKPGRAGAGRAGCPDGIELGADGDRCLYTTRKHYRYWAQTLAHETLNLAALPRTGCPFRGAAWQLWVNHTLAHAEASRRGATRAVFAVCAPAANRALLGDGEVLRSFVDLVRDPTTVVYLPLDEVLDGVARAASGRGGEHARWSEGLSRRYARI